MSGKHLRVAGATGLSALVVIAFGLALVSGPASGAVTSNNSGKSSTGQQSQTGAVPNTSAPTATTGTSTSKPTSKSSTTQQQQQAPQVTTPSVPTAPTDTPSVPAATSTPTPPTPTATPVPTWHTLGTWSGTGSGDWGHKWTDQVNWGADNFSGQQTRLTWTCTPPDSGEPDGMHFTSHVDGYAHVVDLADIHCQAGSTRGSITFTPPQQTYVLVLDEDQYAFVPFTVTVEIWY